MGDRQDSRTHVTLLVRLCGSGAADQEAWAEFVDKYGPHIYRWCRSWQLQPADAEDITQQVLLKLAEKMKEFDYDPSGSFRAWLKTVTYYAWRSFANSRSTRNTGTGDSRVNHALESLEAREDLARRLEEEFDRELLEHAVVRVRLRVRPHTWEAFRLTALEGVPGAEAAARLNMKVANVYVARSTVQRLLQEERQKLEDECGAAGQNHR
jgi:RNA polymerase sigma-70 factor (ECF subfamily)